MYLLLNIVTMIYHLVLQVFHVFVFLQKENNTNNIVFTLAQNLFIPYFLHTKGPFCCPYFFVSCSVIEVCMLPVEKVTRLNEG
jgi:hypothetical protein